MDKTVKLYFRGRSWGLSPVRAWAMAMRIEREMRTWVFEV